MAPSTFHNHTTFCDGASTMEEMVQAAIAQGCASIGLSGHSYTSFDESYCMSKEGTRAYWEEIDRLRACYPQIRILRGVEQDYFSEEPTDGYDYVIGSVHYVKKEGVYLGVDDSPEDFKRHVDDFYGGDVYALCEDYFALVADVFNKTSCTVVGHFDLVTKYNEADCRFSTEHPRYRRAATVALDALISQGCLFEVNTGAMARGYRTTPYPQPWVLDRIREAGCKVLLSADCHNASQLLFGLEDSLARGCEIVREL